MKSVVRLESKDIDFAQCLLCQKKQQGVLSEATEKGLSRLREAASVRDNSCDRINAGLISRINEGLNTPNVKIKYHRTSCYAVFTNKTCILALTPKSSSKSASTSRGVGLMDNKKSVQRSLLYDKMLCIFCQTKRKESLRRVQTEIMSKKIQHLAQYDENLQVRINGGISLIADEALYHSTCLITIQRNAEQIENILPKSPVDISFPQLCHELQTAASKGQVLQLDDVWNRYLVLANGSNETIPQSFVSRRSTFKEKLQSIVGTSFHFYQPLDKSVDGRNMLLIPVHSSKSLISKVEGEDEGSFSPSHSSSDDELFRSMVHVALSLRRDLEGKLGHDGLNVSKESATAVIPERLHLFLNILLVGEQVLNNVNTDITEEAQEELDPDAEHSDEDDDDDGKDCQVKDISEQRVKSIAQDIVFAVSKGKKWTPKHIGLALTIHQKTRSRQLITLLNRAGHCLSYAQLMQVDTTLANKTLQSLDPASGAVVPPNLSPTNPVSPEYSLIHFAADNIDLIPDTVDGKGSFHATQMVAFQRGGISLDNVLQSLEVSKKTRFAIPPILGKVHHIGPVPRTDPSFSEAVKLEWYEPSKEARCVKNARNLDLAFIAWRKDENATGWTEFNKNISTMNPDRCVVGYMPLILQPAHEFDTLCTVLQRCKFVSEALKQSFTVLTVDQNLYCKLLEIKWAHPRFSDIILKMGGLHIAMNFQKAIGQHMENSGLAHLWVESDLLAVGSAQKVLEGKAYAKAMRTHKITYQALWRILYPKLLNHIAETDPDLHQTLVNIGDVPEKCIADLFNVPVLEQLEDFVKKRSSASDNFSYWWSYVDMVSVILLFVRSMRDGDWDLYLSSLSLMLPYIARYDHLNYLKSMSIYIAEMHMLPDSVEKAFRAGNFVVKESDQRFNQVDADHAQEWIVNTGKSAGGVKGITNQEGSLQRWALSFHMRSYLTESTFKMFEINTSCNSHIDTTPGRHKRDKRDENSLLELLSDCRMFSWEEGALLQNVLTKDVAPEKVKVSLLHAKTLGQEQVNRFVSERLIISQDCSKPAQTFHYPVKKNSAATFRDLMKKHVHKPVKKVAAVDRNLMQRIIFAYEADRPVDLHSILQHELFSVPLALAESTGVMRSGDKASLMNHIISETVCPSFLKRTIQSHLIIDAQAMIQALGRPSHLKTFGDMADFIGDHLKKRSEGYDRLDVVFDRYINASVKSATRQKRSSGLTPVRRVVEGKHVPLPKNWPNFLALSENKEDFARFLSTELSLLDFGETELILSGGFQDATKVFSSEGSNVSQLESNHEEADTRLVLHAIFSHSNRVVVSATDTDVFLLLVYHFEKMHCSELWMMAGTSKKRKFIPVHEVYAKIDKSVVPSLLAYHAVTGCDVTSFIVGITKKAGLTFLSNSDLLLELGKVPLTDKALRQGEEFVVQLYKLSPDIKSANAARYNLFGRKKTPESLPPTTDALHLHIRRAHFQTFTWENAHIPKLQAPSPSDCGWKEEDGKVSPVWTTRGPVPEETLSLIYCGCATPCRKKSCGCRKKGFACTALCRCSPEQCENKMEGSHA